MEEKNKEIKVISVCSTKGGSGKSTICAGISAYLAHLGLKILVIDADTQPSISHFYRLHKTAVNNNGLHEFLTGSADPLDCISETEWGELHVMLSNDASIHTWIAQKNSNVLKLKEKINELRKHYDYIFIDSPGTINKLTEAVSIAGDLILTPVEPTEISASEFKRSTLTMISEAAMFRQNDMPDIKYFVNKKMNSNGARLYAEQLKTLSFPEFELNISYLNTEFSSYVCYADSSAGHRPVHLDDTRAFTQLTHIIRELFPELETKIIKFAEEV